MNVVTTTARSTVRITASHVIGTVMVLVALGMGAGFGTLTSPDAPANANTPEQVSCSTMCPGASFSGGSGKTDPAPLLARGSGGAGSAK